MCDPRPPTRFTIGDQVIVLIGLSDVVTCSPPVTHITRIVRPEGDTVIHYFDAPIPPELTGDG